MPFLRSVECGWNTRLRISGARVRSPRHYWRCGEGTQPREHARCCSRLARQPSNLLEIRQPTTTLPAEVNLDRGELEAIALAEELAADLLSVDEWDARIEAERRRLRTVSTLRVLADGARRGLTDLEESSDRLRHTNFRVNSELLKSLLEEYRRDKANDRQ